MIQPCTLGEDVSFEERDSTMCFSRFLLFETIQDESPSLQKKFGEYR